jgi:hypothetical protein
VPPVPPIAPLPGASDNGSDSEVELHHYRAVPTVPAVAPALLSAATPAGLAGSGAAGASYAERTSALRECSCESASARGWGHSRRDCAPLEGPRTEAGLSVHGTKPAGQRNLAWLGRECQKQDKGARAQARRRTWREVTTAVKGREAAKARGKQEPAGQGAMQSGSEQFQKRQEVRRTHGVCEWGA